MGTLSRRTFLAGTGAAAAAPVTAPSVRARKEGGTLRFVPHADLKILDPIWTTACIIRNHVGVAPSRGGYGSQTSGQFEAPCQAPQRDAASAPAGREPWARIPARAACARSRRQNRRAPNTRPFAIIPLDSNPQQ